MSAPPTGAAGAAFGVTVAFGPPATPEQGRGIRAQELADAEAAVARLEAKVAREPGRRAFSEALQAAKAEVERLRQRVRSSNITPEG